MLAVVKHKHVCCHSLGCNDEAVLGHIPAAPTSEAQDQRTEQPMSQWVAPSQPGLQHDVPKAT